MSTVKLVSNTTLVFDTSLTDNYVMYITVIFHGTEIEGCRIRVMQASC